MTTLTRERLPAGASTSGTTGFWALVVAGAATLETPGARSRVLPGDAVLVDARTAHRLTADVETDVVYGDLWRAVPSTALPSPLIVREFRERQVGVVALVMACPLDAKCSKDLFSASYAGLIGAAMSSLWRDDVPGAAGAERGVAGAAVVDAQVAEVVAALAERPGEPWTLDRMAGLVHLSRSALTDRFRRATGHSPMRMLREVRMNQARRLLTKQCLAVTRVAFEVGYGSVAAFSRAFTADHGVSPLAWRTAPTSAVAALDPATNGTSANRSSGARYAHERPADTGGYRRARADHEQQADAVPVQ
jgi:AraC-like DNA-binding protein